VRETLQLVKEFLFPGRHQGTAIPPLDGGLTPNDGLEHLPAVHDAPLSEPDDVLRVGTELYVTSGTTLLRLAGGDRRVVASFDGEAGALARAADGRLLVCVAGVGVVAVDQHGATTVVAETGCPTDLAVAPDGTVYVTDGSTAHHGPDWVRDLMERNRAGRLLRIGADGATTVLATGLAYASGVTLTAAGDALLVSEAWAHRISRFSLTGTREAALRENLPGYPGRLSPATGGYWLAVFALRTQLVEFVLTQRDYVAAMMDTIEPEHWIRPALRGLNNGLEPLQGGQIRKLGVIKPWAPPRSYGLVARLDDDGHVSESLHSRGGRQRHGVTSVRQFGDRVLVAVRGGDVVLEVAL
jgi:hypothetical protein